MCTIYSRGDVHSVCIIIESHIVIIEKSLCWAIGRARKEIKMHKICNQSGNASLLASHHGVASVARPTLIFAPIYGGRRDNCLAIMRGRSRRRREFAPSYVSCPMWHSGNRHNRRRRRRAPRGVAMTAVGHFNGARSSQFYVIAPSGARAWRVAAFHYHGVVKLRHL